MKITVIVSYSGQGGVEVVTTNLLNSLAAAGVKVELLLIKNRSHLLSSLSDKIHVRKLKRSSAWLALPEIMSVLKSSNSDCIIAIKDRAVQITALAARLTSTNTPLIGHIHNNMITGLEGRLALTTAFRHWMMRLLYARLDKVFGVSQDTIDAVKKITGLPGNRLVVMPNPIITDKLFQLARQPAQHPWLQSKKGHIFIGCGRLSPQKNFSLLIDAFAIVKSARPDDKLIILGEGGLRSNLLALIEDKGLSESIDMPGFTANPYAEISRADTFVLSSAWEGSPTVVTEALSLGIPVVATVCGDVAETLSKANLEEPVEQRSPRLLAAAMIRCAGKTYDAADLQAAVHCFTAEEASKCYLAQLESLAVWRSQKTSG